MPKVNGEVIHQPLHVGPLAIPLCQAMDREGVPKIVQPRLEATAVGAPHAGIFPEPLEGILQRPSVNRRPASADEEVALGVGRRMRISPPARIIAQHLGQSGLMGTSRDLKNLVSRMVSREFAKSTSADCQVSASPRRNPAP